MGKSKWKEKFYNNSDPFFKTVYDFYDDGYEDPEFEEDLYAATEQCLKHPNAPSGTDKQKLNWIGLRMRVSR